MVTHSMGVAYQKDALVHHRNHYNGKRMLFDNFVMTLAHFSKSIFPLPICIICVRIPVADGVPSTGFPPGNPNERIRYKLGVIEYN